MPTIARTEMLFRAPANQAVGATEGFTIVLCSLKCLLESGSAERLVSDKAKLIAAAK